MYEASWHKSADTHVSLLRKKLFAFVQFGLKASSKVFESPVEQIGQHSSLASNRASGDGLHVENGRIIIILILYHQITTDGVISRKISFAFRENLEVNVENVPILCIQ